MTYPASEYTFLRHPVDYPPPGEGWELAFVVATSSGGGSHAVDPCDARSHGGPHYINTGIGVIEEPHWWNT